MSAPLRTIVYVSTAAWPMREGDLEALLALAVDLNLQNNVTGVLLYADNNFMQCFEGPEPAVAETYTRIKASQRHKYLIELMDEPVAQRSFGDWQMGLAQPTGSVLLTLSTAQWKRTSARLGDPTETPAGLALLQQFWTGARRRTQQ